MYKSLDNNIICLRCFQEYKLRADNKKVVDHWSITGPLMLHTPLLQQRDLADIFSNIDRRYMQRLK